MDSYPCGKCSTFKDADDFYWSKGQRNAWCKSCYRDWYHARREQHISSNSAAKTKRYNRKPVTFNCRWCGTEVTRTVGINGNSDFCSARCKNKDKNERERLVREAGKPTDRRCAWCGVDTPQSMRADAHFCSAACNSHAHHTSRKARARGGKGVRSRPLLSFVEIAERDHWMCGICHKPVNRKRIFPDPLAGSLDHIMPLSVGGSDEDPANVQLAHFRCNWSKGNRPANDQLRLIG